MCDDVHGTNLQAASFAAVVAKIKEGGRPCTLVFGDGKDDPAEYAEIHTAYKAVFEKYATYNPSERKYNKTWDGPKGWCFGGDSIEAHDLGKWTKIVDFKAGIIDHSTCRC